MPVLPGPVLACAGWGRQAPLPGQAYSGMGCQSGFKLGQPAPSRYAGSMIVSASLIRQGLPALCRPARAGSEDCSGAVLAAGLFCAMLSVCAMHLIIGLRSTAPPRF